MKSKLLTVALFAAIVSVAQTPRLSLYEEFTGENCPPCAATNPGLDALLHQPANEAKIAVIKWMVPIPSAPGATWSLYQTNKTEIDWRSGSAPSGYGYLTQNTSTDTPSSGVGFAPCGFIDGQHQWVFGAGADHPGATTSQVISTAQSYTSAFSIDLIRIWDPNAPALTVSITIRATANFNSKGNLFFRTVMIEKQIEFVKAPGKNGEKHFEDVAIKSFPTYTGTPLPSNWVKGQTQTFTLNCAIPSYCRDKRQVSFVGFIQDDGDRTVAQAVRSTFVPIDLQALSVTALSCSTTINPVVAFRNVGSVSISSFVITPYLDGTAQTSYTWSGNLVADFSVNNFTLNPITTTVNGVHTVSVVLSNVSGVDNLTHNNIAVATVTANLKNISTSVVEGFSITSFPPPMFTVINADTGSTFQRTTLTGAYKLSPECCIYPCYDNVVKGDQDELILPELDLTSNFPPTLSFDVAYARRDDYSNDRLQVMISKDCGNTWQIAYDRAGSSLMTNPLNWPTFYVPSMWRHEVLTLPGYNSKRVLVRFVVVNDNGNNIFIDNINLKQGTAAGISAIDLSGVTVYPNPSSGLFHVDDSYGANIVVTNALGQKIFEATADSDHFEVNLNNNNSGIYLLSIKKNGRTEIVKIVKQ